MNIATVEAVAEFAPGADPDPDAVLLRLRAWELGQLGIEQLPTALACELISSCNDVQGWLFFSCHLYTFPYQTACHLVQSQQWHSHRSW